MEAQIPLCKKCKAPMPLKGLEDREETNRRADEGTLQGFCPIHDWQNLSLEEQKALAAHWAKY